MEMIFPGMDPFLENPLIWSGFHSRFLVYLADQLQPQLRPRYIAAVEDRVFVEVPPRSVIPDVWIHERSASTRDGNTGGVAVLDRASVETDEADEALSVSLMGTEIHESFIEILDRQSGQRVVTVIEVLSPTNKFPGPGRDSCLAKQHQVLTSTAHLIEIDLLRLGEHTLAVPQWTIKAQRSYDYLVSVNRAQGVRASFDTYPRTLRERLPRIRVPLAEGDRDVTLNVQAAVTRTYELGCYRDRLNYEKPCVPALSEADQVWANELIKVHRAAEAT